MYCKINYKDYIAQTPYQSSQNPSFDVKNINVDPSIIQVHEGLLRTKLTLVFIKLSSKKINNTTSLTNI